MKNYLFLANTAALPNQNASALRIMSIARAFSNGGRRVIIAGQMKKGLWAMEEVEPNISLLSLYDYSKINTKKEKIKTFIFAKEKIKRAISTAVEKEGHLDGILIYQQLPPGASTYVVSFCKRNGISLLFDIVEFQTVSQQNIFTFFQFYLPNLLTVRHYAKKGKVLCISTYLERLFEKQNVPCLFVPFFFDVNQIPYIEKPSLLSGEGKLNLLYAGCPSRGRDSLAAAVKGLALLNEDLLSRIQLTIAGATKEDLLALGVEQRELSAVSSALSCLGKVNHETVVDLFSHARFSLYLKPAERRFSKAGFPTKVSESWSFGTPVIGNPSGDFTSFAKDRINSVLIPDDSPMAFAQGVLRAMALTDEEYLKMSKSSRETAEEELNLKVFAKRILGFVEGEKNEKNY